MPSCAVPSCVHGDISKRPVGVKLHLFPKDSFYHDLWLSVCGRANDLRDARRHDVRVCSAHFLPSDYLRDLKWELLNNSNSNPLQNPRRLLKPTAVPSRHVPYPLSSDAIAQKSPAGMPNVEQMKAEPAGSGEVDAAAARLHSSSAPLDPERRAALVQQAIADTEEREARQAHEQAVLEKFRLSSGRGRAAADGAPEGGRRADRFRFESPPPSSDDYVTDDDDMLAEADCLERQLQAMVRMQRKIAALERRLVGRRRRLREVTKKYEEAASRLDRRRGMDRLADRRKMVLPPPPPRPSQRLSTPPRGGSLLVLRPLCTSALADLPPGDDLTTLPTDLPMALRVIFRLRLEVLALRSRVLQRAFREASLRCEMMDVNREHANNEIRWMDSLDAVFTPAQKARLRPDCRHVPWGEADFLQSIALRWVCRRRTFDYVRNTMKIPLPSMFSVRAVAAFGRFPEVTRRYKELSRHKKLRFTRSVGDGPGSDSDNTDVAAAAAQPSASPAAAQPMQMTGEAAADPTDAVLAADGERPTPARSRARGGRRGRSTGRQSGRGVKRKADPSLVPAPVPAPARSCWMVDDAPLADWGTPLPQPQRHQQPADWPHRGRSPPSSPASESDVALGPGAAVFSEGRQAWAPHDAPRRLPVDRPAWAGRSGM